MAGKSEKLVVKQQMYEIFRDKLEKEGWNSIRHFTMAKQSSMKLTSETTRRLFIECDYKSFEASTVANVALHLNFTRLEIKDILQKYTNDTLIWRLIGDDGESLSTDEASIISMLRKVAAKSNDIYHSVAMVIGTMADGLGIDVSEEIGRLRKIDRRKRG